MAARKRVRRKSSGGKPDPELAAAEEEILFPFQQVTLFGRAGAPGETVVVKAWDIDTSALMTPILLSLQKKITSQLGASATLPEIVMIARHDLETMLCKTLEWTHEEFREKVKTGEEFLALLHAMWVTSVNRPGGGGNLPLIIKLADRVIEALIAGGLIKLPSPKPSTSSSEPDTPSSPSGG